MKKYLLVLFIVSIYSSLVLASTLTTDNLGIKKSGGSATDTVIGGDVIDVRIEATISNFTSEGEIFTLAYISTTGRVRVYWYDAVDGGGSLITYEYATPISYYTSFEYDANTSDSYIVRFTLPSPPDNARSFQIRGRSSGEDGSGDIIGTNIYSSGNTMTGYATFVNILNDFTTEAPTLDLPLANATVPTDFTVQYDQPETAYEGSVKITLTRTSGSLDSGSPHVLEVESEASGTNTIIDIKGGGLGGATGVSLYSGGNTLVDDAVYTIRIEYQDLAQNTAAWDENDGITYDINAVLEASGGDYNAGTSFNPGSQDNAFFRLKMENLGSGDKDIDKITIYMLGSFSASDIDLIEIWSSTNDTFGSDTQVGQGNPDAADKIEFDFSPDQSISSSAPTWYFFTIDVNDNAENTDSIGLEIRSGGIVPTSSLVSVTGLPLTGSTHPLPVTLTSFTVVLSGQPVIYWTTQSETNNAYWNIYRGISQNLGQAIQINDGDMILGQGTSTEPTDYSYIDNYPILENTIYWYWLECVDNAGEADILGPVSLFIPEGNGNNGTPATPDDYGLKQNYPNPFNPDTKINFALVEDSPVRLTIYNIKGEKIKTIFDDFVLADMVQTAYWNGKDESGKKVASGVYLYRLRTNKTEFNRRMLLMK